MTRDHQKQQDRSYQMTILGRYKRPWWHSVILLIMGIAAFTIPYLLTNSFNTGRMEYYHPYLAVELIIPRVEWMIIPYFSAYIMALVPLFVFPFLAQKELIKTVALSGLVGAICFLLFPTHLGYLRAIDGLGYWRPLFELLWAADHPHNLTPSMHITMAYLLVIPASQYVDSLWKKRALQWWFVMVCASIVLVHQHHILDIASGWFLAVLFDVIMFRPGLDRAASIEITGKKKISHFWPVSDSFLGSHSAEKKGRGHNDRAA